MPRRTAVFAVARWLCIPLFAWAMLAGAEATTLRYILFLASVFVGIETVLRPKLSSASAAIGLACCAWFWHEVPDLFRYYPAIVSGAVCLGFVSSYWAPRTVIEQIAFRFEPTLPPEAQRYCRTVNHLWAVVTFINALIVVYLAQLPEGRLWSWYTGVWSYLLFGFIFALELAIRTEFRRRLAK